jgi:hypothetical protein
MRRARREMLPLQPGGDAGDDADAKLGMFRKLGGDVAEERISLARVEPAGRRRSRRREAPTLS